MTSSFKSIPIEYLMRGRYQPRITFCETALKELAQSIQSQGLIEPLIVRQLSENRYELIAGERRWRAAMLAGLSEVPCVIHTYNDQQAAAVALIENIQRENLSVVEEAKGYYRLVTEFHFQQDEIASLMGKSRSHVANTLRLLSLCPEVQEQLHRGDLSSGHARMLVGLNESLQKSLSKQVMTHHWSVRKLEQEVRSAKQPHQVEGTITEKSILLDIARLETTLSEHIGFPVELDYDGNQGGCLKIKFYDNDTLTGLLERMGLHYD